MSVVPSPDRIRQLLVPFGLQPTPVQIEQISCYLDVLLRWNHKINLTAVRDPQECVTRHFGESLFVSKHLEMQGSLLDIGSGPGFPGLALKIAFPVLSITLLEPVAKKRAFLKEAARTCAFAQVEVRAERLEQFAEQVSGRAFDLATMRAVGGLETLVPLAGRCIKPGGSVLLWLTRDQAPQLRSIETGLTWSAPLPIPLTRTGEVWTGTKPE